MHRDDLFSPGMVLYDFRMAALRNVMVSQWQQLEDSLVMSSGGFAVFFSFPGHLLQAQAVGKP